MSNTIPGLLLLLIGCGDKDTGEAPIDIDEDGWPTETDCDDADPAINPDATEVCDGIDNDCNEAIDDDDDGLDESTGTTWYRDADDDGHGDDAAPAVACLLPEGHVDTAGDCDDGLAHVNPGAPELCDGVDNDCDGESDEDSAEDAATWYADSDGDGYGSTSRTVACDQPAGFADNDEDCDDGEAASNPGAIEVCDELDNDCDKSVDEDVTALFYLDADSDGYGDPARTTESCSAPAEYVSDSTDCDDLDAAIHPAATEVCDEHDNDCDGTTDDDDASLDITTAATWYADRDGDGYGTPTDTTLSCAPPSGYVADSSDCNDTSDTISPDAVEVCNEIDDDCNGSTDDDDSGLDATTGSLWYSDDDGDGYGDPDDTTEACVVPSGYTDNAEDCDPDEASIHPGATDTCDDGIDQSCSGSDRSCDAWSGVVDVESEAFQVIYADDGAANFGSAMTTLDWDGDGEQDLVIGASLSSVGTTYGGAVYIYTGPLTGGAMVYDASDVEIYGTDAYGYTGSQLKGLGDLDGDGDDELFIGASSGPSDRGIIEGGSTSGSVAITTLLSFTPYCYTTAPLGDPDGDGTNAWACAFSNSAVYIYEGLSSVSSYTLSSTSTTAYTGTDLNGGEDLDGDGLEDLFIGAKATSIDIPRQGAAYLILGPFTSLDLDTGSQARFLGVDIDQELGDGVETGDINNDGYTDYLVTSQLDDNGHQDGGAVYGFLGPVTGDADTDDAELVVYGNERSLYLGQFPPHLDDWDGDGQDDLIVSAPDSAETAPKAGAAWLFYGALSGTLDLDDAETDGAIFPGQSGLDSLRVWGATSADLTGDGLNDLVLGAPNAEWDSHSKGTVYVMEGF